MIEISVKKDRYMYNVYHLTKAFFSEEEIRQQVDGGQKPLVELRIDGGFSFCVGPEEVNVQEPGHEKRILTQIVYRKLSEETGRQLSWGMLTGVRPTKMIMQRLEKGEKEEDLAGYLEKEYFISPEKAYLGIEIAKREQSLLDKLDYQQGYSLYIGIPFCPSICSYCSFSSAPIAQWRGQLDNYVDALCRELRALGKMAKGRKLNTVYIGGGTPTTLSVVQLEKVLLTVSQSFPMENMAEYTVEAGRPDSITEEKLQVIRHYPVTRISINPQTMQQKTLDIVGRRHTVGEVKEAFYKAREAGFDNINMDLIAGLPGENASDMADTLAQVEGLMPDSLTVHALAIKRAAKFGQEGVKQRSGPEIQEMIESAGKAAARMGMKPYYLYRQKNIAGNFENVGYAKVDKAGIYNILIMEEKQTILAAGAGATTKIVLPEKIRMKNGKETNLIRMENVKNITEYMKRIDEMIERKGEWLWR